MTQQRDAVRSQDSLRAWLGLDERLHDFELAKHGGGKQARAGAVFDEQLGDLAVADVGRGPEGVFPVAEAPVDGCTGERGSIGE